MKHISTAHARRKAQQQTLQDMRRIRMALEDMRPGILQDMQRTVMNLDASRCLRGLLKQS